ncbi:alpha/beta hydrolase fold protein, partial [Tanacetum coccineum]
MASLNAGNIEMHDYGNDLRSIKRNVLYRGVSELNELYSNPLRAGIALQFMKVGMLNNITEDMIGTLEENQEQMITSNLNTYESMNQQNEMEISLTHIGWYMDLSRPKGGYYDSYKNPKSKAQIENRKLIVRHHHILNEYWKRIVEEKEEIPQQESATVRMNWLYPGTAYRRIVEPLDIAEHYKMGNTNYKANRDIHYQLLESWSNTEMIHLNSVVEIRKTNLTTYSCFWADVEEALISLRDLSFGGSGHSAAHIIQEFKVFEADVMCAINNRLLSPDIFLEGSSFMKWWISYKGILRYFSIKMDQNIDIELKHYVSNMYA